jgi:hypothetical protein
MTDTENNSLLGDILAAASSAGGNTSQPPMPARKRFELEDFLGLNDEQWGIFLSSIAPDDLVVICTAIHPAWRNRVLASLDTPTRHIVHFFRVNKPIS